ncbi:MAG TPA: Fur family transcriptional regulator [Candidatus Lumbricidophila sp.]|nr:Fur family transcriptional regulator [Candidatus Lumbricidophila sp.]
MNRASDTLAERLHAAGLKVTAPRKAVLEVLTQPGHRSADSVFDQISVTLPTTSRQAVYGVLGAFVTAGLARKIEPAGSPALYESRTGDNHHHLVCTNCHRVTDVDCAIGLSPCLEPSHRAGFLVLQAEVTYWGLCPDCQHQST